MEPGVASSAIALLKVCYQISHFISKTKTVDSTIKAMYKEIIDLSAILENFEKSTSKMRSPPSSSSAAQGYWTTLTGALKDCRAALEDLTDLVQTVEVKKGLLRKARQQVKLDWKYDKISFVQQQVATCRYLMDFSVQMIILYAIISIENSLITVALSCRTKRRRL
jgi:hypothetical protein